MTVALISLDQNSDTIEINGEFQRKALTFEKKKLAKPSNLGFVCEWYLKTIYFTFMRER